MNCGKTTDADEPARDKMTVRDEFAAKAMQAVLATQMYRFGPGDATLCYKIASVMLEAREEATK